MLLLLVMVASPGPLPACPNWLPGTDIRMPPGVEYNYSAAEKLENKLKCYCARVAPLERECKKRHGAAACRRRTLDWVEQHLGPPLPPRAERGSGRNVIVNVHNR